MLKFFFKSQNLNTLKNTSEKLLNVLKKGISQNFLLGTEVFTSVPKKTTLKCFKNKVFLKV